MNEELFEKKGEKKWEAREERKEREEKEGREGKKEKEKREGKGEKGRDNLFAVNYYCLGMERL